MSDYEMGCLLLGIPMAEMYPPVKWVDTRIEKLRVKYFKTNA
jgi:hypothetical protein